MEGREGGRSSGAGVLDSEGVRAMVGAMGAYAAQALGDGGGREALRRQCAERLQEALREGGGGAKKVQYAEQAVLANLDWGIDGLEKAAAAGEGAGEEGARAARLEHAERMLQVAVLLNPKRATAGVPNAFLSAWASFYLALVWKLRADDHRAALHLLDMFRMDPSHARRDFAPALWDQLFRPHMANVEAWYRAELAGIMAADSHKSTSLKSNSRDSSAAHSRNSSRSRDEFLEIDDDDDDDDDACEDTSSPPRDEPTGSTPPADDEGLSPDQIMRRELLNKLYQDSLDENTVEFARYWKDWMPFEDVPDDGEGGPNSPPPFSGALDPPQLSAFTDRTSLDAPPENGTFVPGAGAGVHTLQKRVSQLMQPSADHDSFSDASFKDASGYSRDTSMEESSVFKRISEEAYRDTNSRGNIVTIEEGNGGADHQDGGPVDDVSEKSARILVDNEDDEGSVLDFDKGAGVFLDGEELTKEELLQVWEEIAEGRIGLEEANDFLHRLTGDDDQAIDFKRLSEVAEAIRGQAGDNHDGQQHSDHHSSPDSGSLGSNYTSSPQSDIEEEEEEAEVKIRQEFDRPDSPDTLIRMHSQTSRSAISRRIIVRQNLYSAEQYVVKPPKDFVCSITNQLFEDPLTLETGQTYERRAIKEWLDRGNTSCPITRQSLKSLKLPKTNYVLKRLVDNWKENHYEYVQELSRGEASSQRYGKVRGLELEVFEDSLSPRVYINRTSIINEEMVQQGRRFGQKVAPFPARGAGNDLGHANLEGMLRQLRSAVETLFRTEDLGLCERAVLVAAHVWEESKCDAAVGATLSRAGVVEGLVEVLTSSKKDEILRSVVCLLADLVVKDDSTRHTILRTDPDVESIVSVLRNSQVPQVAVLLYLLRVPAPQVSAHKVVPFLVQVVKNNHSYPERSISVCAGPKAAAVYILEQLVTTLDHRTNMANAEAIVLEEGVPSLMQRLETKVLEEKISAVAVLWSCLQSNGGCRMLMVQNLKMATLVDLLHNSKEQARTVAIFFLAELVRLNRRRVIEKVLRDVLQEGFLNSMHVLMIHLQMSPLEHRPLVASLLLQLDMLAEPQKHSVYRDEAVEALVDALTSDDNAKVQLEAAKALASLSGRYSHVGKPVTEAVLLKYAGLDDEYKHSVKLNCGRSSTGEDQIWEDEEIAAGKWDQRMASALLENGRALIEALGGGLAKSSKLAKPCVIAAAWLTGALRAMPDSNLISYARTFLVPHLVSVLLSGRDAEGRVLACLSLYNLAEDSVGVQHLSPFTKELVGPLRRLRRYTWTAKRVLEALAARPAMDLNIEMWMHGEVGQLDASQSGEARVLLYFNGYIFSGHADASIKMWAVKRPMPRMVQEVQSHTRSVLCLTALEHECKLFSGSADKTIRIWLVEDERIRCLQVIDVKEAVYAVAVSPAFICVVPQGVGLKMLDADGQNPRLLNAHKHVQSISFGDGHIYCGCTDNSIQEIDPVSGESITIQNGRNLRTKRAVYSIQVVNEQLYAGGMVIDGVAAKVWKVGTKALVSSLTAQFDVRAMAISEDLLYLASNLPTGVVEVWSQRTWERVASFTVGSRVLSVSLVGETLYTASADGRLRAWALV